MPYPDDRLVSRTLKDLQHKLPPPGSAADRYDQYASVQALIERLEKENGFMPYALVELIVGCGFLDPDNIVMLGHIQLAPGVVLDASKVFWEPVAGRLALPTASPAPGIVPGSPNVGARGGYRYLDRISTFLTVGSDGDGWWEYVDDGSGNPQRLQRVFLALEAVLAIVPARGFPADTPHDAAGAAWSIADVTLAPAFTAPLRPGRWCLVDRRTGSEATFTEIFDATIATEHAQLGDPDDRWAFLDRWNANDPGGN